MPRQPRQERSLRDWIQLVVWEAELDKLYAKKAHAMAYLPNTPEEKQSVEHFLQYMRQPITEEED